MFLTGRMYHMSSMKSEMVKFVLKNSHYFMGQAEKGVIDENTSIEETRNVSERFANRMNRMSWMAKVARKASGIRVEPVNIYHLYGEWILPAHLSKDKVMLYLHGGGYVFGSCNTYRSFMTKLVAESNITALIINYRLAPEHPFPAALDDAAFTYQWLLSSGVNPEDIIIAGDSAGGGLVFSTLLALRDRKIPLPAAAVVMSPWTDLTFSGESVRTKKSVENFIPEGCIETFGGYYTKGSNPADPYISPLFGELEGLPPMMIHVGEDEILLDDSVRFAEKAVRSGVDCKIKIWPEMFHCFPLMTPAFPEAVQGVKEIAQFAKQHIHQS